LSGFSKQFLTGEVKNKRERRNMILTLTLDKGELSSDWKNDLIKFVEIISNLQDETDPAIQNAIKASLRPLNMLIWSLEQERGTGEEKENGK
jgi:hypothetical protein